MKKKAWSVLSVIALAGTLVAGCGNSAQPVANSGSTSVPVQGGGAASTPAKMENKLVIAGNGATVEKLMKDEIFKKFNEKYPDVKLSYVSGVSTEIVAKVKAQQNSPQIDIAIVEGGEQEKGRTEGLWQPITATEISNAANVSDDLKVLDNSGVTVNFTPMGISYNSELVKAKGMPVPESWNDLTRPEMKGNLTLTDVTSNFGRSTLIMLAYTNGGSEKEMEEGFKKLETIAGYMPTFAKSAAQLQQNLQSKTSAYTAWTMARSITQKKSGLPLEFVFPKEGANIVPNVAVMVKGAKHPEAAKEFINFLLTDEVQNMYASKLYYNPATKVNLPDEIKKQLDFDRTRVVNFDYSVLGNKTGEWVDRFNKEIAPRVGK
ncbi:ABC transporter substrate-binding protein [Brevibacillus laterosporus]|uniref:ABC transporter substrate-binding protein n=1 Tax=Brevibacillus laterosporus TaxID=1465 RepID=A0A518V9P9_BRELA|nr:ABC transporter substrate-binding protein [Brevibacillus laterosporus]